MKKPLIYSLLGMAIALIACSGNSSEPEPDPKPGPEPTPSGDIHIVKSSTLIDLWTDKAIYKPGDAVTFTLAKDAAGATKVRYRNGLNVIKEEAYSGTSWSWTAPSTDFQGYIVDVYNLEGNTETIFASVGVDVSSDYAKFVRNGFVATFDRSKLATIEQEMEFLNRCHINVVQFQDWHNKHHWPYGGADYYKDIANREISTEVVKKYIATQHGYGMKSLFYNLCFGGLSDYADDGVKVEWGIFNDTFHNFQDRHVNLPSSWKSTEIYLFDPANTDWQQYLAKRNDDVYNNLEFDGYQIDQLGDRGDRYDYNGNKVNLQKGYASFINAMKQAHPTKCLVMNAVSAFGASQICGTGKVDFCYNEVWGNGQDEDQYSNLHDIIKANDSYSKGVKPLSTVFAAYMNYGVQSGSFNMPGILLTDAVMFALGGSHLELGDHMLSNEYFPNNKLTMSSQLKAAIIRYYDFLVAYENLLRGTTTADEYKAEVKCESINVSAWPPKTGGITTYSRKVDSKEVIHMLNFRNASDLSWRDYDGKRATPMMASNIVTKVTTSKTAKKVWCATPDKHGGVPVQLEFEQSGNQVSFTVPSLNYWTMIVIE